MKRATTRNLCAATIPMMLAGCALLGGGDPSLTPEQLAYVRSHDIVVQPLPVGYEEPLLVHTRSGKIGADIGVSVATSLLFGGISFSTQSQNGGPRDRFSNTNQSLAEAIKRKTRQSAAEEIYTSEPTRVLNKLLAERYPATVAPKDDNLTISTTPVAWHLYYGKGDTFTLEYAGDITLKLPAAKIKRTLWCDRKSEQALTREQWLENDAARIRSYAQETALQCANQALDELQLPRISAVQIPVQANDASAATRQNPADGQQTAIPVTTTGNNP